MWCQAVQLLLRMHTVGYSCCEPDCICMATQHTVQLTQKKTTLQFKTLDSTVQTYTKDGRKEASTMRCADMDKQVPDMMGVSKVSDCLQGMEWRQSIGSMGV